MYLRRRRCRQATTNEAAGPQPWQTGYAHSRRGREEHHESAEKRIQNQKTGAGKSEGREGDSRRQKGHESGSQLQVAVKDCSAAVAWTENT
jgi:hypothetical protein